MILHHKQNNANQHTCGKNAKNLQKACISRIIYKCGMSNSSWFGCCFTRANLSLGGSFERMPHFLFCFLFPWSENRQKQHTIFFRTFQAAYKEDSANFTRRKKVRWFMISPDFHNIKTIFFWNSRVVGVFWLKESNKSTFTRENRLENGFYAMSLQIISVSSTGLSTGIPPMSRAWA